METRKLYYEDCHMQEFTGVVTGCEACDKGFWITLDQTAFYPEGGGQACDLGTLGDAQVLDVQERGEQVCHLCSKPLSLGETVRGQILWARRFDLMQQHTGEHILSGLIHDRFGYHNNGFHVGTDLMEVDFDGPVSWEELMELEAAANQIVWRNLPIHCFIPSPQELSSIPYRTKRQLPWPVRIVEIPGVDTCACCGIHVGYTGEVGLIKIVSCTKFHSGVRLEMVCGNRAYRYINGIFGQNRDISRLLSAKMTETAPAVEKLQEAYNGEKFRATALEKKVFEAIALGYQGQEYALHFAEGLSGGGVRELADGIAPQCTGYAAVFSGCDESGYQFCIVSRAMPVKELGTKAVQALNGRGGGKDYAFQGTLSATKAEIQDFFCSL